MRVADSVCVRVCVLTFRHGTPQLPLALNFSVDDRLPLWRSRSKTKKPAFVSILEELKPKRSVCSGASARHAPGTCVCT